MANVQYTELLEAGVHFGHLTRKWNPKMAPYILMEKNGIHIIDLHKTVAKLDEASTQLKQIAKSGKKVLFVATKNQAKSVVSELVGKTGMPFITERWSGGMLTNFATIRKAVKKILEDEKVTKVTISTKNLKDYLENPIFEIDPADKKNSIGIANGLAWTAVGGDVLKCEAIKLKGKGI